MHRNLAIRLFLVFLVIFLMSFVSYYNVWISGDQTYSLSAPKNYVFLNSDETQKPTVGTFNESATLVSYGRGITINSLFDISPTLTNETIIGHIYLVSLNARNYDTIIENVSVTNASNPISLSYDIPAGKYEVVSFTDFYFTDLNYTSINQIQNNQPGSAGTVVVVMPFPGVLFLFFLISGFSSIILLAIAVRLRREHYISFDRNLSYPKEK